MTDPSTVAVTSPAPMANAPSGDQPAGLAAGPAPVAGVDRTIHMIGNAHLDPVWLWPWQEGYAEARATFWSAIHRMEEYPDFIFTCDQIVLLSWVRESDPELFARIRERVDEGRWVNVGGWWVEPDCNTPMGESFVRQGLYGQRFLLAEFGRAATVGMNVDPFGHSAMIPAILRGQGMDSYTFLRPGPHESDLFDTPFWWVAPDGSRVLAARIPFEYCSPPGEVAGQVEKALGQLDKGFAPLLAFYGVGNHGGGPTRANIESIHRYNRMGSFGKMIMSSPRSFFDEVAARLDQTGAELPQWREDLQHHAAGCYSAHSGIKAWQRRAQHAVLNAERWAIMADLMGGAANRALRYPREELGLAWRQVLFNQFHDVLPGSAIESAYDDARDQLGEAVAISKRIITRAHNVIARQIDIPLAEGTQPVVVFNHHPWPLTADVEINYGVQPTGVHVVDAEGTPVLNQRVQSVATTSDRGRGATVFRAELPALGYRLFRLEPGDRPDQPSDLSVSGLVLENAVLRLEVDRESGWLSSLLDKQTGRDMIATATGEHIQVCADPTDTWGHRVVSYAWPGTTMPVTSVEVTETGPVRGRIRVERSWGRSTMVEEIVLAADADAVEVRVTLDWREAAHLMKLRVPLALEAPTGTYEIPFATLERPVDGAEEPAQSWVDLSGRVAGARRRAGMTVINNAKHGYDVSPAGSPVADTSPSIGITAVRSAVYSWHDPKLLDETARYTYQDQGPQRFSYLLVPHASDWRPAEPTRRAAQLGAPPRAMLESFHTGPLPGRLSFLTDDTADEGSVMITAVKGSEDDGGEGTAELVVRAVETQGRAGASTLSLPVVGREFTTDFGPYQLRTFVVPADPDVPIREVDLVEHDTASSAPLVSDRCDPVPSFAAGALTTSSDRSASDARRSAQTRSPGMVDRDR